MKKSHSERYSEIKQIFGKNIEKIIKDSKASKIPNTLKLLLNAQRKIDEFICALNELVSQKHAYAINAIMRVVYEHYIVAHYVWLKSGYGANDDCANEYYQKYKLGEALKRTGHDLDVEGIINGIEKNNSPENLRKLTSKFNITEAQIQDGYRVQKQFEVKNILKYVLQFTDENNPFKEHHLQFPFYLSQYNFLSSYVHGGPSAEDDIYNSPNALTIKRTIEENITHAQIVSETIKLHMLFLLIEYDSFYARLLKPIMEEEKPSQKL